MGDDILIAMDEYTVFENRLQKGIFGKTEDWRKLHDVEIRNLFYSRNVVAGDSSMWAGHKERNNVKK